MARKSKTAPVETSKVAPVMQMPAPVAEQPTGKKLEEYTENELRAELQRRAELERLEKERLQREHEKFIYDNVDFLLKFVPNHSKTSCSDENQNYNEECRRCILLQVKENEMFPPELRVEFQMTWENYFRRDRD